MTSEDKEQGNGNKGDKGKLTGNIGSITVGGSEISASRGFCNHDDGEAKW